MTAASSGRRNCLLEMLLGGATLIAEPHHTVRLHRQVGDDEAGMREQLVRMPFDFGDYPALLIPALRLILDAF